MEQGSAFENPQVQVAHLPDFRRVELQAVAPSYLPWSLIHQCVFWLVAAAVMAAAVWFSLLPFGLGDRSWAWWAPVLPLMIAALGAVYARLDFRIRAWALREHDLVYRYGVLWRKIVILPFARIQHVEATHGPLERKFGLMQLKCYTAGGASADLTVAGLDQEDAHRVREYLLEQIAAAADSGADTGKA